jgi:hypothetical protein
MERRALFWSGLLAFAVVFSQIAVSQMHANPRSVRDRLIGTWQLVSSENLMTDGTKRPYPELGPNGKGYLMYAADGHMCAELMNPDRPKWEKNSEPTPGEEASAFEGIIAYCGRFEVDEGKKIVYHIADVAWSPDYLG